MASKVQQAQRFINFINQQLKKLKRERETVIETVDDAISQVQNEVDAWINGGLVNQTTCVEINNRIQHVITLFMTKTMELSDVEIKESESVLSSATRNNSKIPKTSYPREELQETAILSIEKTVNASGVDTSSITTMKFDILEEAVYSLKKSTEQMQEKQEVLNKKLERLTNAKFKSEKKIKKRITVLEKTNQEMSSNVETVRNIEVKLNKIEEENKSVKVTINELNEQISSVRTCSNDALMSLQDLSKSVESTNQHYNEMSNKMNQLEISINLMSSQYTEKFENEDKGDDLIGMVCQLLSKGLTPLETLNETLNKKVILSKEHISKVACSEYAVTQHLRTLLHSKTVEAIDTKLAELSGRVIQIESKFSTPTLLFNAFKAAPFRGGRFNIGHFNDVPTNYGSHLDPFSGKFTAPQNGFYLISIEIKATKNGSYNVKCFRTSKNPPFGYRHQLCSVYEDECVTFLVEFKEGDKLWLEIETMMEQFWFSIRLQFSCHLIK